MTRALCCKQAVTFLAILLGCLLRVKTVSQYLPVVCRHQLGGQPISQPADRTDSDQFLLHRRLRPIRSGQYHNNPERYTYLMGERMG